MSLEGMMLNLKLQYFGHLMTQRVGHDWATELNWTELNICTIYSYVKFVTVIISIWHIIVRLLAKKKDSILILSCFQKQFTGNTKS